VYVIHTICRNCNVSVSVFFKIGDEDG